MTDFMKEDQNPNVKQMDVNIELLTYQDDDYDNDNYEDELNDQVMDDGVDNGFDRINVNSKSHFEGQPEL